MVSRAAERASGVFDAVGDVVLSGQLKTGELVVRLIGIADGWVFSAVEHKAAHPLGVEGGVGCAEEGSVREPEVVEFVVFEVGTDDIHVASGRLRV